MLGSRFAGPCSRTEPGPPASTPGWPSPRKLLPRRVAAGLLALLVFGAQTRPVTAQVLIETIAPPPGFEDLLAPQTTVVDVYVGDELVGTTLATYAPGSFTFGAPDELVRLIPNIPDPALVARALSGELDPHPDLVCVESNRADCGVFSPDVAGVIFDATRFRVDVFVNPAFLGLQAVQRERFLRSPITGLSGITSLAAAVSGSSDDSSEYNIRNRTIFSYRDTRLRLDSSGSSADGLIFDTAFVERDRPGSRLAGGVFRTQGIELIGEEKILGAHLGTSLDTRTDLDIVSGTQLIIFLPRRSQVEIFRENRLISSQLLEAGNQLLDTSLLPGGAYDVVLRIREIGGAEREETRFFVKSLAIPPLDAPIYFVEGGVLVDDTNPDTIPALTDTPIFRAGTRHRLADGLALGAGVVGSDRQALLEVSGFSVSRFAQVNAAGIASTDGDVGASLSLSGRLAGVSYALGGRRVWAGDKVAAADIDTTEFDPITASFSEARATLSYRRGAATVGFQAHWRDDDAAEETFSLGPTLRYDLIQNSRINLSLQAEAARTQDEDVAIVRLRFRFNEPRWAASATAGYRAESKRGNDPDQDEETGPLGEASLTWRDRDVLPGDLSASAGVVHEPDLDAINVASDYAGSLGRYAAAATYEKRDDNSDLFYSGTAAINWLTTTDGIVLSGRDTAEAAVVIDLDGSADATEFEVLVDDRPRGTLRVGQRLPLALPAYEEYDIRIRPTAAAFVDFDVAERAVTLYPGNVARLAWTVQPVKAVYGRALWPDGTPVAFARVSGAIGEAVSDDLGYFQAEVGEAAELTFKTPNAGECFVQLGELSADRDLISLGTVTCE